MKRNTNKLHCVTNSEDQNEAQCIDLMKSGSTSKSSNSESPGKSLRSPIKSKTKISDRSPTKKVVDHLPP